MICITNLVQSNKARCQQRYTGVAQSTSLQPLQSLRAQLVQPQRCRPQHFGKKEEEKLINQENRSNKERELIMSDQAKYIYLPVNFPLLPPAVYSSSSSSPRERANLRRIRNQVRKKHIGMNICAHGMETTPTQSICTNYTYQTIRRQVSRHQGAEMRHVLHE